MWPQLQNIYLNDNNLTGTLPEVGGWGRARHGREQARHAWPPAAPSSCTPRLAMQTFCPGLPLHARPPARMQDWGQAGALPSLLQLRVDSNRL